MLIEKVLEFRTLFLKNSEEGLTADEMCNYSDLFSYLKYEKFKDIESYRLDFMDNTSTTSSEDKFIQDIY